MIETIEQAQHTKTRSYPRKLYGILAEYSSPDELIHASRKVRDAGFVKWDTHSPYPVHGIDPAMGIRMTKLPWIVFAMGCTGFATGLILQYATNVWNYPYIISGKPMFSIPACIPVCFELTVLFSAFGAFFGMLILNNLPQFWNPLFESERFRRATNDKFFLHIQAEDPKFEQERTRSLLQASGAEHIEELTYEDKPLTISPWVPRIAIMLMLAGLVPVVWVVRAHFSKSAHTRIHIIPDMDFQNKLKTQKLTHLFADGRSDRMPVPGTIAVGELREDDHLYRGKVDDEWANSFPMPVTEATMKRGEERYNIYCALCHGYQGQGDGMVDKRADAVARGGSEGRASAWIKPAAFNREDILKKPLGEHFNTITNGLLDPEGHYRMPSYKAQIPVEDRWAIVLYLKALQKHLTGKLEDVPDAERVNLVR